LTELGSLAGVRGNRGKGTPSMAATYAQRVGERLRAIRLQKGLSLHDVEEASSKEFKASVLGAYERGERSISVPRLQRLAIFYGVPVDQLLPRLAEGEIILDQMAPASTTTTGEGVRIDLTKLKDTNAPEVEVLSRYLNMIQMARGDFNGKVLTVRELDIRALAAVFDLSSEALTSRLEDLGLRIPAAV
jgi:transcriptional regulator with XRE-family HTH domain